MTGSNYNCISVLLPSYNPTEKILDVIKGVVEQGFSDVIVIDDGSGEEHLPIFDCASEIEGCTVLRHEVNKGKGAALKTGMEYFMKNRRGSPGIVTTDDDGQHLPADIRRCADDMLKSGMLTLGIRRLKDSGAPFKSRFGNGLTKMVFKHGIGLDISDTQTGLRAIPEEHIESFINVPGSRFEYETNMLIAAKEQGIAISETPITAVYDNQNKNTRFRAVKDSLAIYFQFFKYAASALLSACIDILSFFTLFTLLVGAFPQNQWIAITLGTFLARAISSVFNFLFNKNIVFGRKNGAARMMVFKYYALCAFSMFLSSQLVALISMAPFIAGAVFITLSKLVVDSTLFIMNYIVQKRWVFK